MASFKQALDVATLSEKLASIASEMPHGRTVLHAASKKKMKRWRAELEDAALLFARACVVAGVDDIRGSR